MNFYLKKYLGILLDTLDAYDKNALAACRADDGSVSPDEEKVVRHVDKHVKKLRSAINKELNT